MSRISSKRLVTGTYSAHLKTTKLVLEKFHLVVEVFATLFLVVALVTHSCRLCFLLCELRLFLLSLGPIEEVNSCLNPAAEPSADKPELLGLILQPPVARLDSINLF